MNKKICRFDNLVMELQTIIINKRPLIIGIDGFPTAGKTTLGNDLARELSGVLISIDDHLHKQQNGYLEFINYKTLSDTITLGKKNNHVLICEGICINAVLKKINSQQNLSIYVWGSCDWKEEFDLISNYNFSGFDDHLKNEQVEFQRVYRRPLTPNTFNLRKEIADYHKEYDPIKNADIIYTIH